MPERPTPAEKPKRVAVVGAGPAGMVCALVAARRGHSVTLVDASEKLGGKLVAAGTARIKFDVDNYRVYLEQQIHEQIKEGNLELKLGEAAMADSLAHAGYDAIVCAAGALETTPPIPGLAELVAAGRAVSATRLLREPELLGDARSVTVIGGGAVGCEVAQWLAVERNVSQVNVVEALPHMMQGACTANRGHLLHTLAAHNARLLNMTRVERVEKAPGGATLHVSRNRHKNVPDPYVSWTPILPENVENPLAPKVGNDWHEEDIASELVVIACGGRADDKLFYELQRTHAAPELHNIGDGFAPGRILEAVRAAYRLGSTI